MYSVYNVNTNSIKTSIDTSKWSSKRECEECYSKENFSNCKSLATLISNVVILLITRNVMCLLCTYINRNETV